MFSDKENGNSVTISAVPNSIHVRIREYAG